ncbi:IucA/IucC family siderophore biosynthesis protein [Microbulbifer sp. OS29]|uniref:IucA/IucC family siderophore biosynthesis protein n=1 Tax=Microbulbifer okhotskensis TaxID=2926617 RepID=A0A9X2J9A7_9GAMM|nr:IucA/IucC family protein [Microbulbifer okhotskensis]MCO1336436.1 IucA/IucC family siderophore biosynthesis protein [Microbulbifer okhotskensis]
MSADKYWKQANRALLQKSMAELCYEQALRARAEEDGRYSVTLTSGVIYRFKGQMTIWDWLLIDSKSIERESDGQTLPADDAAQFFIDAGEDLEATPSTLGNLLHELANTLVADVNLLQKRERLDAQTLAALPDEQLQCLLDGHPKAMVNKGRIGWGAQEFNTYGTEAAQGVRLLWLAVRRELTVSGSSTQWDWPKLLAESLSEKELHQLDDVCQEKGVNWQEFLPLPVHPWQWQHHIRQHYAQQIFRGELVLLGEFGDEYLPQVSLRTLSNLARPQALHVKLPLTVLNTSCYRGIPGKFMRCGPALSEWMEQLCKRDEQLQARGTGVLQELAGVHVPHLHHELIDGTPYRYRELLGATWRQSPASLCVEGERHLLMAALLQRDASGKSVVSALIEASGLSVQAWLEQLFDATVVPLYHLLSRYGVGLVAHSQNLTLVLRDNKVVRVLLKDFQGDLRLAQGNFPDRADLPEAAAKALDELPANYIIHDLFTGHFVTVLRYLSTQLMTECGLKELEFYQVLARVLRRYQASAIQDTASMAERFQQFNLFRPHIERVCINRVRLRQGYDDSAERPVPIVGGDLDNPLWLAEQESQQHIRQPETASAVEA